jgi:hypothetical protein
MNRSRALVGRAFHALNWLLGAVWLALLVVLVPTGFSESENPFGSSAFPWLMSSLVGTNTLASVAGVIYVLVNWRKSELRGAWLISFFFGLLLLSNVALLPLFRHYVLGRYERTLTEHSPMHV